MSAGMRMAGMLLCRAGACRLAFAAHEVAAIVSASEPEAQQGSARRAFGEPPGSVRLLVAGTGDTVGVDTLEIDAEPYPLLPVPALLRSVAGGSLRGFVHARGALWPLVGLTQMRRFLDTLGREEP